MDPVRLCYVQTDTRNQLNREACHRKSMRCEKAELNKAKQCLLWWKAMLLVIIVHLAPSFVKCWCLPLVKCVQNSKNGAKNKILLKINSTKAAICWSVCGPVVFAHLQCGIDPRTLGRMDCDVIDVIPRQTNLPKTALTSMCMEVTYNCRLLGLSLLLALAVFAHM